MRMLQSLANIRKTTQIGYAAMNAIGTETFHGQHRGTGAGLQYTCNRIAGIVVSLLFTF